MLDELDVFVASGGYVQDKNSVMLAVWLHDAIYQPTAKDNEEESAGLARNAITSMALDKTLIDKVTSLIMATKHTASPSDNDEQILIDLDLMILGAPPDEFNAYEIGIRKEYNSVSENDFAIGRSKILKLFYDRYHPSESSHLYQKIFFRRKYELAAHENLARSIEKLKQLIK